MTLYHLHAGQRITLGGAAGRVELRIAGGFRDPSHLFAEEALVEPATMARLDASARTTAVLVRGTASAEALARAVAGVPGAKVYDRAAYVRHAADQLQQGMRTICGFLGVSLLIAVFGMATTVSLGVADRIREFGLLGAARPARRRRPHPGGHPHRVSGQTATISACSPTAPWGAHAGRLGLGVWVRSAVVRSSWLSAGPARVG